MMMVVVGLRVHITSHFRPHTPLMGLYVCYSGSVIWWLSVWPTLEYYLCCALLQSVVAATPQRSVKGKTYWPRVSARRGRGIV